MEVYGRELESNPTLAGAYWIAEAGLSHASVLLAPLSPHIVHLLDPGRSRGQVGELQNVPQDSVGDLTPSKHWNRANLFRHIAI